MGKILVFTVALSAIFVFTQIPNVSAVQGRLLTPEEGCGFSAVPLAKIVGGTEAKPGAFPWIALIGYTDFYGQTTFRCGGTLITSRHVLTSAHCVIPDISFVRLGEHNWTSTNNVHHQNIKIVKTVIHPKRSVANKTNDIAILTLQRDVEFTDRIRPICLPLTKELQSKKFVGANPIVAGWGKLSEDGRKSDVLMQVQSPVINNTQCQELYKKRQLLFSKEQFNNGAICAGNLAGGESSCHGDSGGPLMLPIFDNGKFPMYQIGVVSYALGCARPNMPTVFMRVSHFIDWINEETSK